MILAEPSVESDAYKFGGQNGATGRIQVGTFYTKSNVVNGTGPNSRWFPPIFDLGSWGPASSVDDPRSDAECPDGNESDRVHTGEQPHRRDRYPSRRRRPERRIRPRLRIGIRSGADDCQLDPLQHADFERCASAAKLRQQQADVLQCLKIENEILNGSGVGTEILGLRPKPLLTIRRVPIQLATPSSMCWVSR